MTNKCKILLLWSGVLLKEFMDVSTCLPYGARMSLARLWILWMFNPEVPLWKCCSMRSFWVSLLLVPGRGKLSKVVEIQIIKTFRCTLKDASKICKEHRIAQQNTENWSVFMKHSTEPSKWPLTSLYISVYILKKKNRHWGYLLVATSCDSFHHVFFSANQTRFAIRMGAQIRLERELCFILRVPDDFQRPLIVEARQELDSWFFRKAYRKTKDPPKGWK